MQSPDSLINVRLGSYIITGHFPEQGGMSQMYSAVSTVGKKQAVVKVILMNPDWTPEEQLSAIKQFVDETRIVSGFNHQLLYSSNDLMKYIN